MDFPEAFPLITDPGDLIIFAERTYHGVFPHNGTEVRLSCGLNFRPKSYQHTESWTLPDSAKKFITDCPTEVCHLVDQYLGIDWNWRGGTH